MISFDVSPLKWINRNENTDRDREIHQERVRKGARDWENNQIHTFNRDVDSVNV